MSQDGMDIAAVEGLARTLEASGVNQLSSIITQVSGLVQELMVSWTGPDAEAFDQQWADDARALSSLHTALGDLVQALNHAMAAQQWASDSN